jgi:hypothetical protein
VFDYESSLLDGVLGSAACANGSPGDDPLANMNKDEVIKEFLRKNFLKFYVNIYKDQVIVGGSRASLLATTPSNQLSSNMSSTNLEEAGCARYMLDVHLFKGTVCVFLDFVRRFTHVLTAACSQCSTHSNYDASSSNHSSHQHPHYSQDLQYKYGTQPPGMGHSHDYNLKIFM